MTPFWVAGLIGWLALVISFLALEPVHRWLVKHRWAVDGEQSWE